MSEIQLAAIPRRRLFARIHTLCPRPRQSCCYACTPSLVLPAEQTPITVTSIAGIVAGRSPRLARDSLFRRLVSTSVNRMPGCTASKINPSTVFARSILRSHFLYTAFFICDRLTIITYCWLYVIISRRMASCPTQPSPIPYSCICCKYVCRFPANTFDPDNETHNTWQMQGMPIQAGYCDAWFTACRHDLFCAEAGGDFFSCAQKYVVRPLPAGRNSVPSTWWLINKGKCGVFARHGH